MKDIFAILHDDVDGNQFLVNSEYEPEDDTFKIMYKFWSERINGYLSATLTWASKNESDYLGMFEKFKDNEYCLKFKLGTEAKLLGD